MIAADATSVEDLEQGVQAEHGGARGKADFVLHSIGMSPNVRKEVPYDATNYNNFAKPWIFRAISFHKMLGVAKKPDAYCGGWLCAGTHHIAAGAYLLWAITIWPMPRLYYTHCS